MNILDTLNILMMGILSTGLGQVFNWGVPQLFLAVFTVLAARRHKLPGMWLIAAAAILSLFVKVALALLVHLDTDKASSGRVFASLNFYPSLLVLLLAIVGWAKLAFPRTKKVITPPDK
jgi:hypothetical protein